MDLAVRRFFFLWVIPLFFWGHKEGLAQCGPGFIRVQGRVLDANRRPVRKVDLDFFHIPTGIKLVTPHDNTDSSGFYDVCIFPPSFYRVTFDPLPLFPENLHLVGKETLNVDLRNPNGVILPDVVLRFGQVVAGRAIDTLGQPVDSVKLSADNLVTGERVFIPKNKTDSLGDYRAVIPNGIYRLRYTPLLGRRQLGIELDSVRIAGRDTTIDLTIHPGLFVSGTVLDTAAGAAKPIADVGFDIKDTLGNKIFLPHNKSDSTGKFTVVAPPGIFDLLYIPPRDSHFVAKRVHRATLAADTAVTQPLHRGVLLTVTVRDSLFRPVPLADLDVIREFPTRNELFTPTDNADSAGVIKVAVPPDSYTLVINPPIGSTNFDTLFLPGLAQVFQDTSFAVILPGKPVRPVPETFSLGPNAPNPFNNRTEISYALPEDAPITLRIYNILGQTVRILKEDIVRKGAHSVAWDGRDDLGRRVPAGVYFYRLTTTGFSQTKKMILVR